MNHRTIIFRNVKAAWLAAMFAAGLPVLAAPVVPAAETNAAPRSVFNQPANPQEGRDPFFPTSFRPYPTVTVPSSNAPAAGLDVGALVIQGVSGSPEHRLVIINNVTFAAGDNAEVSTSQGRIHIHCLEINGNSAIIEANGQRHELRYGDKP